MANVQELSQDPDIAAAIEASGESTLEGATTKAQELLGQLNNVTLNIAVTGETGSGKSSFINAIRGLSDDDEGAAETGVYETTTETTPYKHPNMPNVTFWDLPGIGTESFKAKDYLKKMQFDRFDFFVIISSGRFKENDVRLAKEIKKKKKSFYFVRSKIDLDIAQESRKRNFDREETLRKIRKYCQENLREFNDPRVFLISRYDLCAFDFEALVDALMLDLPELKQKALIQSLPVTSVSVLKKKVMIFEKLAWAVAASSVVCAVASVPGLSLAFDTNIVVTFFTSCYFSFGLDDKSLEKLSKRVNKPELNSLMKCPLVQSLVSKSVTRLAGSAGVEFLCSLVPGVGSAAAAAISFSVTYKLLSNGLRELEEAALMLLREAGLE